MKGSLADTIALLGLTAILGGLPAIAQSGPQPPCGASPVPPYPDQPPVLTVKIWKDSPWTPAACTGWSAMGSPFLVAAAARFRPAGGMEGLRHRLAAVSEISGLLYWSTTNQKWQPLLVEAYAVSGPSGDQRRKDFSTGEIASGQTLYAHQEDHLLGPANYRTRIIAATAGRLVFSTENTTAIQRFGLTLFAPGQIQSICFLDRESKDLWRYYSLTRMAKQAGILSMGHDASFVNRTAALYRYLAGIPADQEPPAAR